MVFTLKMSDVWDQWGRTGPGCNCFLLCNSLSG
jgi:hypothetical protein